MSNILIIKHGSLGDIVQISGVIKDIREANKNEKIFVLTTLPYVELFSRCPYLDGVILDKRLPRWNIFYLIKLKKTLSKFNFAKVFDLQNSSRTSFYGKFIIQISDWSSTKTTLKKGEKKKEKKREKRKIGFGFWVSIGWMILVVIAAFLAPVLPIPDPDQTGAGGRLDAPNWDNWFGTDTNGRDMFSRTIWGSRVSLTVGFFAIVFGFAVGGPLGIVAGFFKGATDKFLSIIIFILFAFPGLVLAL